MSRDFPSRSGGAAIGARLRRLSDRIDREADGLYAAFGIDFEQRWFGTFLRCDTLAGASFADRPLVRSRHYWTAGIGIAWMIGRSSRWVDVDAHDERVR